MSDINLWMDPKEKELILKYIQQKPDSTMLEWGCGGSTLTFSKEVNHYVSIEHNLDWYINVQDTIKESGLSNIDFNLVDISKEVPTAKKAFYDKWETEIHELSKLTTNSIPDLDYCIYPKNRFVFHEYIDWVDKLKTKIYDFVLIDGRARADCAFKILNYIDDDSIVFIHDYWKRPPYQVITEYYDVIDSVQDTLQTIVALKRKK